MSALWNVTPRTVEEAIVSVEAVKCYETIYGETCPPEMSVLLTNELMLDIMRRIVRLESRDV